MDFSPASRRVRTRRYEEDGESFLKNPKEPRLGTNERFSYNLQLYSDPPDETLSLPEMFELAIARKKVLLAMENALLRYSKNSDEYVKYMNNELRRLEYRVAILGTNIERPPTPSEVEERKKDYLSHFILRLVYCQTNDLRQWFTRLETELFRWRFSLEKRASIERFLQSCGLNFVTASDEEKEKLGDQLFNGSDYFRAKGKRKVSGDNLSDVVTRVRKVDFYKVFFGDVLDMVSTRKVFIKDGFAYVPQNELVSIMTGKFRSSLSLALTKLSKRIGILQDDERFASLLKCVGDSSCAPSNYTVSVANESVTSDMIPALASVSFPPCMRVLYRRLCDDHHMRNGGRMQLGLFLKGIGMPLDESLRFWKSHFAPKTDGDKFEREYAYHIRYNYGKEGRRVDYSPFSCYKIITTNPPGPLDAHGCPFKHYDIEGLQMLLSNWSISGDDQEQVLSFVKTKHYDRACSCFFEVTHQLPESSLSHLISHPNQYYDQSRRLLKSRAEAAADHSTASQNGSIIK